MSQREKRHQRRPKYFDEHKLDDNDNQVDEAHVQIGPDDIDSSVPQKVTKRATKRKSTTYHDSDDEDYSPKKSNYKDNSSDEDFKPASKKSKSSKAVPKSRKRISLPKRYGNAFTSDFQKTMDQVGHVLKSLNQKPGFGDCLVNMLPKEHSVSSDAVASFLCFVCERQEIWSNKRKHCEVLTTNHVLSSKWFTNMYRELDRGTMYLRNQLNQTDLKGVTIDKDNIDRNLVSKILLKSVVYRLINKLETFMDFGGVPDIETLNFFLKFLRDKKKEGSVIFTAAHQVMGFDRLVKSINHLKKNIENLSSELVSAAQKRSLKMCQTVILTIPNIGNFFAWQIMCDLIEVKVLGRITDNQWACLGPGAKNGLRRIFCLETTRGELRHTRLLRDLCRSKGSKSGFAKLGLQFPVILHKDLSLKNVEHALCEYDKYFRFALEQPTRDRSYQTRGQLDKQSKCGICSNDNCDEDNSQKCLMCNSVFHKLCEKKWKDLFHMDGSWLCRVCHEIEKAWSAEDFEYEEEDPNDLQARAFRTGEQKAASSRRYRNKKQGKITDLNNNFSLLAKHHCRQCEVLIKRNHIYSKFD